MVSQQQSTRCEPNTGKYTAMPETPSSELMQALLSVAQDRDKKAFAYLFEYFSPKIKRFGIKQFGVEAQAMELVQETLTSVWRKAHLYNSEPQSSKSTLMCSATPVDVFRVAMKSG